MILKNSSTEYLLGEAYWSPLMKGLTAAELERPPLSKWKMIMRRVPVCLAASEFLNATPQKYPTKHPIKLTWTAQIVKAAKYSKLLSAPRPK